MTINEAVLKTGFVKSFLSKLSYDGKIIIDNGQISDDTVQSIIDYQNQYVSFIKHVKKHRKKVLRYLEQHNYFDIPYVNWTDVPYGQMNDIVFFHKNDLALLDSYIDAFTTDIQLSESEKVSILFNTTRNTTNKELAKSFLESRDLNITPIVTQSIKIFLDMSDIQKITNAEIEHTLSCKMMVGTKDLLVQMLNYGKKIHGAQYDHFSLGIKESNPVSAYSDDLYLSLATCIFGSQYIADHSMIEKALENHLYAEAWLYISLFYCCGWRAQDVCRGWKYLDLFQKPNGTFGIDQTSLKQDLLNDSLSNELYENVCLYALGCIDASMQIPSKTNNYDPDILQAVITSELLPFFGLLTLIAEVHMLTIKDGYMIPERASRYQHRSTIKSFFGQQMYDILGGENLQSRRLNKDFLQGVEETAIREGASGLLASTVASYARNHTNLNTISKYLRDHNFSGTTAEFALYCVMQRGVFGVLLYQSLITVYPDKIRSLSLTQQNEIICQMNISAYRLEQLQSAQLASRMIQDQFLKANEKTALKILKGLFEVSQNQGKAKDNGVHCLKRVFHDICPYPEYDSCLANCCPHLVMTKYGYIPLLKILKTYRDEAMAGNKKSEAVLTTVLIPTYRNILNAFMEETNMNASMRNGMKRIMEDTLNGS